MRGRRPRECDAVRRAPGSAAAWCAASTWDVVRTCSLLTHGQVVSGQLVVSGQCGQWPMWSVASGSQWPVVSGEW